MLITGQMDYLKDGHEWKLWVMTRAHNHFVDGSLVGQERARVSKGSSLKRAAGELESGECAGGIKETTALSDSWIQSKVTNFEFH